MQRLLRHPSVWVRFLALYGLGLGFFILGWVVSYYALPEGILKGRTGAALLAGEGASPTVLAEFLRIAGLNLAILFLFVLLPNRMVRVGDYPLGYFPPLVWSLLYAVTLGTNSFTIPMPERLAPSLSVLGRSGLYEIAAYCLAAVSTHEIAVSRSPSIFSFHTEPVRPKPDWAKGIHRRGLGTALLFLLAACAWEAYRIVKGL